MQELVLRMVASLRDREEGQAMVEYALILGLISVVAIAALTAIGGSVNGVLTTVSTALAAVPGA